MRAATRLRTHGVSARVVDMRAYVPLGRRRFLEVFDFCLSRTTGFVGMSVTTPQIEFGLQLAELVRERKGLPVLWSGVHPTLFPEQTAAHDLVDAVVCGCEADGYLRYAQGHAGPLIRCQGDRCSRGEMDLTTLVDLSEFAALYYEPERRMRRGWALFAGSGGPLGPHAQPPPYRHKPGWGVKPVAELLSRATELLGRLGIEYVQFLDECPFAAKDEMLVLGEGLKELGLVWSAAVGPDEVCGDRAYFEHMHSLGWTSALVDCLSGSDRLLGDLEAGFESATVREAAAALGSMGVFGHYAFTSALPGETDEERALTLELAADVRRIHGRSRVTAPRPLRPYPGSRWFEHAVRDGLAVPDSLEGWCALGLGSDSGPAGWVTQPPPARSSEGQDRALEARLLSRIPDGCTALFVDGSRLQGRQNPADDGRMRRFETSRPTVQARLVGPHEVQSVPDAAFDCVCGDGLLTFGRRPFALLQEVCRVLRPGGKLVLGVGGDAESARGAAERDVDREELTWMLRHAGFKEVFVQEEAAAASRGVSANGRGVGLVIEAYRESGQRRATFAPAAVGW